MKSYRAIVILLSSAVATIAMAQTPPSSSTSPSAASTPAQRQSTAQQPAEAPVNQSPDPAAASSPHQKQVTKHDQMMKDCMAKEQANSATASAEAVKKTCMERMKKPGAKVPDAKTE